MKSLEFVIATEELLNRYIDELVLLEQESDLPITWHKYNFLMPLDLKFDLSKLLFFEDLLIGYVIISQKTEKACHIHRIVIGKSFRNRGIGKSVLESIEKDIFPKFNYLTLLVNFSNAAAIRFYIRNYFAPIYKIEEEILMVKNVNIPDDNLEKHNCPNF